MKAQSFVKGAAILAAAAFFTRFLGLIYKVPYQNITGDTGLFIYQQVYPLYSTILVLATAGFNIAVSKIVSERLTLGDPFGAKRVFRVSAVVLSGTGVLFFCVLFFGAPRIAAWMGNAELLTLPIKSVSFALLIVPVMSVIRGYFQGHQNMVPTAMSQVVEQIVRVITIVTLAYWFMASGMGVVYAGAGAVFGAVTGAIAGLITLLIYWHRNEQMQREIAVTATTFDMPSAQESTFKIVKRILYYALPICLGALVLPLFGLADSFTVANMLEIAGGLSKESAAQLKGIYDRGDSLIQFAVSFATAVTLSIVPAVAEAVAKNRLDLVQHRSDLALRLTYMFGLPASVGLAVIIVPTNIMIYTNDSGSGTLAVLAFATVFSTLNMTSAGILQGVGLVLLPARNLLLGVAVKVLLNLLLIGPLGITGAAIATVVAYAFAAFLNYVSLVKHVHLRIAWRDYIKPLLPVALMAVAVYTSMRASRALFLGFISSERIAMLGTVCVALVVGAVVYALALFRSGAISREDLQSVPSLGRRAIPLLERLRLLK